jgi:hypothetical protein
VLGHPEKNANDASQACCLFAREDLKNRSWAFGHQSAEARGNMMGTIVGE